MDSDEHAIKDVTRMRAFAGKAFVKIEMYAYVILGLMLALTALLGVADAGASLWSAVQEYGTAHSIVLTIDRLLFVLMIVEILHTVSASFRSGQLECEPFLTVGLIASIRRVLVITLQSSQAEPPGKSTAESQGMLNSTMLELGLLGGLILVMVISIYMLRQSERLNARK